MYISLSLSHSLVFIAVVCFSVLLDTSLSLSLSRACVCVCTHTRIHAERERRIAYRLSLPPSLSFTVFLTSQSAIVRRLPYAPPHPLTLSFPFPRSLPRQV